MLLSTCIVIYSVIGIAYLTVKKGSGVLWEISRRKGSWVHVSRDRAETRCVFLTRSVKLVLHHMHVVRLCRPSVDFHEIGFIRSPEEDAATNKSTAMI